MLTLTLDPIPGATCQNAICDNTDSGFVTTGDWTASFSSPGYYGINYLHDQRIDQSEIYYLIRTTLFEPDNSGNPAQLERSTFREFRWWSLAEISAAKDEIFVPLNFAEHFAHLLADGIPAAPYDVGR